MLKTASLLFLALLPAPLFAQIAAAPIARSGSSYQYSYQQAWTSLLRNPQAQAELELVPSQVEKLNALQKQYYEDYRKILAEVRPPGKPFDELARAELAERTKELRENLGKSMGETLLPHQLQRAKEVALQQRLKSGGYAFRDPGIMELLGIDKEQADRMQKRATELRKQASQEYRRLLAEANEKLLEELTPPQREKLKQLTGEKYAPAPFDWRAYYEKRRKTQQAKKDGGEKSAEGGKAE